MPDITGQGCQSVRYGRVRECDGPAKFSVVYRVNDKVIDQHASCFRHGLAEVDRHHSSGGIASCSMEDNLPPHPVYNPPKPPADIPQGGGVRCQNYLYDVSDGRDVPFLCGNTKGHGGDCAP